MDTKKELTIQQLDFIRDRIDSGLSIVDLCKKHKISRQTYYDWMKNPTFAETSKGLENDYKTMLLDVGLMKFGEHVANGNLTALIFLLKTLGGWQENSDVGVNIKTPVIVVRDEKQKEAIESLTKRFVKE